MQKKVWEINMLKTFVRNNMMNNIPVLLIVFNRPNHTLKTLDALLKQFPSELYIFQDGCRINNSEDIVNCTQVREVIDHSLNKVDYNIKVHKHYSNTNRGCRDAIIYAISSVLKEHESVIVVEDDIVTSPAFLSYMNKTLAYYKDNKSVHSVSAYSHAPMRFQVPKDYEYDVFASPRLFNWGWGTWRDRWDQVDWSMSYYDEFMRHPEQIDAFNRGGDDMTLMLIDEKRGRSSAWDIQFAFDQFKRHMVSIVPKVSYTQNIGFDGSGTHCGGHSQEMDIDLNLNQNSNPHFIDTLYYDKRILNLQYSVFTYKKRPLWQKAINFIARKLGLRPPFVIKKRIYA